MKILIVYASTDGQTRKIARFAADHLVDRGQTVELLPVAEAEGVDLARFGAVILAGSVHMGGFQAPLMAFAKEAAARLSAVPSLFLAVSLSAAGQDAEDWAGLRACVSAFQETTGWVPGQVEHVAGAFRFSSYDMIRGWAMRWIAAQKHQQIAPHEDREYTDWAALAAVLDRFAV
ncbi:menaquinone-dependent protoporphyrinogen oxidase [Gemmobacter aquatilis]|uniref:Menaquinone-dependent protoporphyrinogen oxidase n=1 Tax=Gemmobacter aquatilis TaxID=933059 RepID=A0A1H8H330_9RHOB|nr:flavodoxin domain-containing protein [Gemmobacter aquatilis]SEN49878.1 menaquinone-dependent protoporphyrinogen oxidase [Gemmobacter aquatilis]